MKKIILSLFVLSLSFTSCEKSISEIENQALEVATIQGNTVVISNKDALISNMQNSLRENDIQDVKITDLAIDYSRAVDNEDVEIIQLVGSNKDGSIKIGYLLKKENNVLRLVDDSSSLKCEGCRDGCSPRRKENGDGYCTKCTGDYQKCTKTEIEN